MSKDALSGPASTPRPLANPHPSLRPPSRRRCSKAVAFETPSGSHRQAARPPKSANCPSGVDASSARSHLSELARLGPQRAGEGGVLDVAVQPGCPASAVAPYGVVAATGERELTTCKESSARYRHGAGRPGNCSGLQNRCSRAKGAFCGLVRGTGRIVTMSTSPVLVEESPSTSKHLLVGLAQPHQSIPEFLVLGASQPSRTPLQAVPGELVRRFRRGRTCRKAWAPSSMLWFEHNPARPPITAAGRSCCQQKSRNEQLNGVPGERARTCWMRRHELLAPPSRRVVAIDRGDHNMAQGQAVPPLAPPQAVSLSLQRALRSCRSRCRSKGRTRVQSLP